jgi:hypothetical protein
MSDLVTYSWFAAFRAVVYETDHSRLYDRIGEALDTINNRLDCLDPIDSAEDKEIHNAVAALRALSSERSPHSSS